MPALSVDQLLVGNDADDENVSGNPPPPLFRPVLDGWVIPTTYAQTLATGSQNDVPVMTGNNLDENGASPQPDVKLADFQSAAKQEYGAMADEFLKLYPASSDQEAGEETNASIRDSSRVSTYLWSGEWAKIGEEPGVHLLLDSRTAAGAEPAAIRARGVSQIGNQLHVRQGPASDRQIADTMSSYVLNFATSGDPNGNDLPGLLRIPAPQQRWKSVTISAPSRWRMRPH